MTIIAKEEKNMKRNCNGCKALEPNISKLGCFCGLGHEIEELTSYYHVSTSWKPLEACEKPKTYLEYAQLALERSRNAVLNQKS